MAKIIDSLFNYYWMLIAYTLGYFILWTAAGISLLIPPLKAILRDYERTCSLRSMFFIVLAFITAPTTLMILQDILLIYLRRDPIGSVFLYLMGYLIWIPMGLAILSSLHDYKYKKKGS